MPRRYSHVVFSPVWRREQKERERERAAEEREHTTWGVFAHSSGKQNGYVARRLYDGRADNPYNQQTPLKVFKRQSDADKYAEKLTFG